MNNDHNFVVVVPPAPINVRVERVTPTAMVVHWDPPTFHNIRGYRVYYDDEAVDDVDQWQSVEIEGPYTETQIDLLDPLNSYAVRVRAKTAEGRYGELSNIVIVNDKIPGIFKLNQIQLGLGLLLF